MKRTISILTAVVFLLLSFTQCKKECVQSERCELEPDPGICNAAIPKYYFDKDEKKCKQFTYGGCGGAVPFDTMEECEEQCDCN